MDGPEGNVPLGLLHQFTLELSEGVTQMMKAVREAREALGWELELLKKEPRGYVVLQVHKLRDVVASGKMNGVDEAWFREMLRDYLASGALPPRPVKP
jgi:hypothetical protein